MEENKDLISIIMPTYNAEDNISEAVDSILTQTYSHWELLIIDDKSTDNTLKILEKYNEYNINIIKLKENMGVANARNIGIGKSNGNFIAFLDTDDLWYENKLEKQYQHMIDNDSAMSYTSYDVINDRGKSINKELIVPNKISYRDLLKGSKIGCLTVMVNKKKISNLYMKNIPHEDYLTWLNILKEVDYATGLTEVLASYRVSEDSLSGNKLKAARWQYNIYKKELGFNFIKTMYYFTHYAVNAVTKYNKIEKR